MEMTGICTPECGYVEHEAIAILQDLIAELRGSVTYYSHGGCDLRDRHMLERVSRAEARLREVTGDE